MEQEESRSREAASQTVSVVIPALNEADYIGQTLRSVRQQPGPHETIVVDGGSTDGTAARASRGGARVVAGPRGRARQMNAGAARACGDVLLFLHADTTLPEDALAAVRRTLAAPGEDGSRPQAGTFRLRFDRKGALLRFYGWVTHQVEWRRFCYGDRGLFVRRAAFEALGGYPDWPIFEDLELADRLHRRFGPAAFCYLPLSVTTAARRFEKAGPFRQQVQNLTLWTRYLLGTDPEVLAHRYRYD